MSQLAHFEWLKACEGGFDYMRKDTIENVIKIIKCLEGAEGGWLWYRECARRTGLHHKTVSRLISKHLGVFVEEQVVEPFNVKMVRLKTDARMDNMLKFLVVKEKLGKTTKDK